MASRLKVNFRGTVHELPVCYSQEKAGEVAQRWTENDGVIDLATIYEIDSPSTVDERSLIVRRTLKRAGVALQLDERKPLGIAIRDAFKAMVQQENAQQ